METRGYRPSRHRRRRSKQQARRRLLLLAVVVVVVFAVALGVALVARGKKGGGAPSSGGTPVAGRSATPSHSPDAKPSPSAAAPKVWLATKVDPVRVWIGGDSLGGELGWALGPMFETGKSFKPVLFYKTSSGVCRPDFFDWQREIERVMRSARPQAVVTMIGANDDQSIWKDGGWISYGTKTWRKTYEQRVSDMMTTMLDGGARRVYWVGMPVMAIGWRSARMKFIDSLVQRQAANHPGVQYIDAWSMFSGPGDTFLPQWRIGDGVHFTGAGQQKLAEAVYLAVLRDWKPTAAALHASPAASPSSSPSTAP